MQYVLRQIYVVPAMFAGAALGAAVAYVGPILVALIALGPDKLLEVGIYRGLWDRTLFWGREFLPISFLFWLVGITFLGGPIWFLLHRRGWRQPWAAAVMGSLLPFIFMLAWLTRAVMGLRDLRSQIGGRVGSIWDDGAFLIGVLHAFPYGLYGCLVGLLIWRIAYRKAPTSQNSVG